MLLGGEMPLQRAVQADGQEDRADDHVQAVKAGRHEEHRAIDVAGKAEGGMGVFIGLHPGEDHPQRDGQDQAVHQVAAVVLVHQGVVRPGHGAARQQ